MADEGIAHGALSMSDGGAADGHAEAPAPPPRRLPRAPWVTMGLNIALIATIFVTRDRWAAWVLDYNLPYGTGYVFGIYLGPDQKRAVLGPQNPAILDIDSGRVLARIENACLAEYSWPFSSDGTRLLLRSLAPSLGRLVLVDTNSGNVVLELEGSALDGARIGFLGGAGYVLDVYEHGALLWDARTGKLIGAPWRMEPTPWRVTIAPGHASVSAADGDREAKPRVTEAADVFVVPPQGGNPWDFVDLGRYTFKGEPISVATDNQHGCYVTELRPGFCCGAWRGELVPGEGARLLITDGRHAEIWDRNDARFISSIDGMLLDRAGASVSFDGRRLVAPSAPDGRFAVWDIDSGERILTLAPPAVDSDDERVTCSFTPDDTRIVAGGIRDYLHIWDASTGERLAGRESFFPQPAGEVCVLQSDRILVDDWETPMVYRRIRPERWWGVLWLPHLYAIAALAMGLAMSAWRDLRRLRALGGTTPATEGTEDTEDTEGDNGQRLRNGG